MGPNASAHDGSFEFLALVDAPTTNDQLLNDMNDMIHDLVDSWLI